MLDASSIRSILANGKSPFIEFKQSLDKEATDNYQAQTRNKLIAEAFYLTNDIEKYGSGYIRVIKDIATYPTMRLEYEEIGNGYLITLSYIQQKINTFISLVSEQAVLDYCQEPKNTHEIMEHFGLKHREHFRSAILKPLIHKGLLELTIPDKPKNPNQKYKTKVIGKEINRYNYLNSEGKDG